MSAGALVPAILGWSEYRELGNRYALGLVTRIRDNVMSVGIVIVERRPIGPLAHLLFGALTRPAC